MRSIHIKYTHHCVRGLESREDEKNKTLWALSSRGPRGRLVHLHDLLKVPGVRLRFPRTEQQSASSPLLCCISVLEIAAVRGPTHDFDLSSSCHTTGTNLFYLGFGAKLTKKSCKPSPYNIKRLKIPGFLFLGSFLK